MLRSCDYETIDRLLGGLSSYITKEHSALAAEAKHIHSTPASPDFDPDLAEMELGDERSFLEEVGSLAGELAIVALYKKVEISSKRAIELALPQVDAKSLFQFKKMKKALASVGIKLNKLPSYQALDELRCLNNAVKHSGKVSAELAKHGGWKLNAPLVQLEPVYRRLAPKVASYVSELVGELIRVKRHASVV
jgi:hypothetical protein